MTKCQEESYRRCLAGEYLREALSSTGIILLPEGPMLVASRPILTSEEEGPIRGTMIMGRYLNPARVERLAEITHLSLTMRRFDDAQMPPDFQAARSFLSTPFPKEVSVFIQPLSAESIAGYVLLKDVYGESSLVLRVDMLRDIYQRGQTSMLYLVFLLLVSGLAFTGTASLMADKILISRLVRLDSDVNSISDSGDLSKRVSMTGNDELSNLADAINGMLVALEQSQTERKRAEEALRESEQRFRDVTRTTGDWIWEVDAEGRYTYASPVVEQVLGYMPEEVMGRHYYDFFHPDGREELETLIRETFRRKESFVRLADPIIHKDGHTVILETTALSLTDGEGNLLGYRGAHCDVTAERRLEERLSTVYTLGRELVLSRDERQVTEAVVDAARLLLRCRLCGLWLVDEEGKALFRRVVKATEPVADITTLSLDSERGITVAVARTGEPIYLPDVREDPRYIDSGIGSCSGLCVPLKVEEGVIGVLNTESDKLDAFDDNDQQLFFTLAGQAALAIENARLYGQMRAARDRLQTLSLQLVDVQETERRHLARELHDEVGQLLTGLKLVLEMSTRLPADAVRASLDEAQALVNELMARVRELSLDLRPMMLDDLGLLPALRWHFERYTTQTNVHVIFKHTGLEGQRFAPAVETAAYRIVQEALTNVARHAEVSEVTARLWADQDTLGVQAEDRGAGFDAEAALAKGTSSGLSGMQERVALLGGQLTIESAPGTGTRVTAEFPLAVSSAELLGEPAEMEER